MKFSTEEINDIFIVKLDEKRLDAKEAVSFRDTITNFVNEKKYNVVIDFTNITFIDSSGLGALVSALKLIGRNGKLVLNNINDTVFQTFTRTKMDKVFSITKNTEEALKSFS
ncbi:MAG: STAS domain-containing protein [Candidatus Sericytochromatia bacterium]